MAIVSRNEERLASYLSVETSKSPASLPNKKIMTTEVDYSQPLAVLLRMNIMELHDSIASSRAAKALDEGKLPKQEYVRLLMMLWHIYRLVATV